MEHVWPGSVRDTVMTGDDHPVERVDIGDVARTLPHRPGVSTTDGQPVGAPDERPSRVDGEGREATVVTRRVRQVHLEVAVQEPVQRLALDQRDVLVQCGVVAARDEPSVDGGERGVDFEERGKCCQPVGADELVVGREDDHHVALGDEHPFLDAPLGEAIRVRDHAGAVPSGIDGR